MIGWKTIGDGFAERVIRSGADFKRKGTTMSTPDGQRQSQLGQLFELFHRSPN